MNDVVYTPLGSGRIVWRLPDGGVVVQFPHGGGHIFRPEELKPPAPPPPERRLAG